MYGSLRTYKCPLCSVQLFVMQEGKKMMCDIMHILHLTCLSSCSSLISNDLLMALKCQDTASSKKLIYTAQWRQCLGAAGLCQRETHNNMSILPLSLTTTIFVCPSCTHINVKKWILSLSHKHENRWRHTWHNRLVHAFSQSLIQTLNKMMHVGIFALCDMLTEIFKKRSIKVCLYTIIIH